MYRYRTPEVFRQLQSVGCIQQSDILKTQDGFYMVYKSLSDILEGRGIYEVPDSEGIRIACRNFFDDWFLYAVPNRRDYVYSLLKLREQEYDAQGDEPADGDTPGVTVSFISFAAEVLLNCLADATDENRQRLNREINRVVAYRGQFHHKSLKQYFINPRSEASYLIAVLYMKHISAMAENGTLAVPEHYGAVVRDITKGRRSAKLFRVPQFIASLNQRAGRIVCDHKYIYIRNPENPDEYEGLAILATYTGNTSVYSFAAEVLFHARFLVAPAKMRIPILGRSVYDSAIRADMSIGDTELQGHTPYYRESSRIVQEQYRCHKDKESITNLIERYNL